MKVAIIGTGLQANRRAAPLAGSAVDEIAFIASGSSERAQGFAKRFHCDWGSWQEAVARQDIEAVIVCTTPDTHYAIASAALNAGKHVLCEKPLTISVAESESLIALATKNKKILKCGFNHRHHPALSEARKIVASGALGKLLAGRCVYGICGREDYKNEWRANVEKAAGGQLMELGIHALDLFRWFFGEFAEVNCMIDTLYFPIAPFEDTAFVMLRSEKGAMCSLSTSLIQWKNTFHFEIIGAEGYLTVSGLGASYGEQQLIQGKRDYEAPFRDTITYYRGGDQSWNNEWAEFKSAVDKQVEPIGNGVDGLMSLKLVEAAYEAARAGKTVSLKSAG